MNSNEQELRRIHAQSLAVAEADLADAHSISHLVPCDIEHLKLVVNEYREMLR